MSAWSAIWPEIVGHAQHVADLAQLLEWNEGPPMIAAVYARTSRDPATSAP
jgi:hypothetical protein